MKVKEIRALDDDKLARQLASSREELMSLRFSHATGALENPSRLSLLKRQIARMRTVQVERARVAGAAPQSGAGASGAAVGTSSATMSSESTGTPASEEA